MLGHVIPKCDLIGATRGNLIAIDQSAKICNSFLTPNILNQKLKSDGLSMKFPSSISSVLSNKDVRTRTFDQNLVRFLSKFFII